jgi:hypothetical protein
MNPIVIPKWMHKPKNSGTVVATEKGWVVQETGEVLIAMKDLDKRIKAFAESYQTIVKANNQEVDDAINSILPKEEKQLVEEVEREVVIEEKKVVEIEEPVQNESKAETSQEKVEEMIVENESEVEVEQTDFDKKLDSIIEKENAKVEAEEQPVPEKPKKRRGRPSKKSAS